MKRLSTTLSLIGSRLVNPKTYTILFACILLLTTTGPSVPNSQCTYVDEVDCAGFLDVCLVIGSSTYCLPDMMCIAIINPGFGWYCWVCPSSQGSCLCHAWGQVSVSYYGGVGDDDTGCRWGTRCGPPGECYCLFGSELLNGSLSTCDPGN